MCAGALCFGVGNKGMVYAVVVCRALETDCMGP